jgi:hypothetical protein
MSTTMRAPGGGEKNTLDLMWKVEHLGGIVETNHKSGVPWWIH